VGMAQAEIVMSIDGKASMGPRSPDRGYGGVRFTDPSKRNPSMGPRLSNRGRGTPDRIGL
jgi:hypothetical protein